MTDAKEIDDLANALQAEADKFNKASPRVTELLKLADERIGAANPGLEVWLNNYLEPGEDDEWWSDEDEDGESRRLGVTYEAYQVGYARVSDGWGLASRVVRVQTDNDYTDDKRFVVQWHRIGEPPKARFGEDSPEKVVPLRNAPMGVRIKALQLIPQLLKELTEKLRERNAAIEGASKQLKK